MTADSFIWDEFSLRNDDIDYDPSHPDLQHEPPEVCTSQPEDTEPGDGVTDGGDLPSSIPDAPPGDFPAPDAEEG
jgi:hypothetical protein